MLHLQVLLRGTYRYGERGFGFSGLGVDSALLPQRVCQRPSKSAQVRPS